GESEGRDFAARHSWQIFPLLLFGSEKEQWLRDTDRLMRGNERGQVCVPTTEQHGSATVVYLGQTEALVLLGNFHAKRAHREKFLDVFLRDFAGAIDLIGVNVIAQIIF